jgi:WD40 repeat protein
MMQRTILVAVILGTSAGIDAGALPPKPPAKRKPQPIRSVAFSPDGKLLAVGSGSPSVLGRVEVWDVATRKRQFVRAEKDGVSAVAFSPNGALLAVGTYGEQARLLDARTGKVRKTLAGKAAFARCLAFSPNGRSLVTGGYDGTIGRWDVKSGKLTYTFKGGTDKIFTVAVSPDGESLASGGNDATVRLWELDGGDAFRKFDRHGSSLRDVSWSKDGRWLLTSCRDGIVRIYDSSNWRLRGWIGRIGGVECARLSPDGTTLAVCVHRTAVQLFEPNVRDATEAERKHIAGYIDAWRNDDIRVRNKASAALQKLGLVAEPQLRALRTSRDAELRIRARRARNAIRSPEPQALLKGHRAGVNTLAFSPDGRLLATGDESGVVKLWDVKTRREIATIPGR